MAGNSGGKHWPGKRPSPPTVPFFPPAAVTRPRDRFDGDPYCDLAGNQFKKARELIFSMFTTSELLDRRRCSRTWRDAINLQFRKVKQLKLFYDQVDLVVYHKAIAHIGLQDTRFGTSAGDPKSAEQATLVCPSLENVLNSNFLVRFSQVTELVLFNDPPSDRWQLHFKRLLATFPSVVTLVLYRFGLPGECQDLEDIAAFANVQFAILIQPEKDAFEKLCTLATNQANVSVTVPEKERCCKIGQRFVSVVHISSNEPSINCNLRRILQTSTFNLDGILHIFFFAPKPHFAI